jgi:hypothetical protein
MNKLKISIFFSMSLMILGSSVMAAPPDARDDGTGWCDGLDPTSSLYSTCIQAYSATNRLEHLQSKNASANAVSKAQASLDEALAQYEELGGGSVPGLEPVSSCPCNTQNVAGGSLWGSEEFVVGGGVNTGVAPYPPLNGNGGTAQYTVVWEGSYCSGRAIGITRPNASLQYTTALYGFCYTQNACGPATTVRRDLLDLDTALACQQELDDMVYSQ